VRPAVVRAFTAGVLVGASLTAAAVLATPAKAEPIGDAVVAYVAVFGGLMCEALDAAPSADQVLFMGDVLMADGLSARQAGQAVWLAVTELCPQHLGLLNETARQAA
jgi:hypothetical protein